MAAPWIYKPTGGAGVAQTLLSVLVMLATAAEIKQEMERP